MNKYNRALSSATVAHRNAPVTCDFCGRKVKRHMRGQLFCSRRCRQRANYAQKIARGDFSTPHAALPTTPHKSVSNINALQGTKTPPSSFANAPLNILGGGSYSWPNTPALDGETREAIRRLELGDFAVHITTVEIADARGKHRRSGR